MRYEIRHRTAYEYDNDVLLSHHIARLTPRELPHQRCAEHRVETFPNATTRSTHEDHFGNTATFLTLEGAHRRLEITSLNLVEVDTPVPCDPSKTPAWEEVRDRFGLELLPDPIAPVEFVFPSPQIPRRPEFREYARASFPAGCPVLAGALDLSRRIHDDFTFDPRATSVTTPVAEFFKTRRGVCQDFAQFMIACLRSVGLPARYVSGYLETLPPPGQAKLVGADASHAWVSVWCGEPGWVDIDPTNDVRPRDRHVTVAWGRDFSDVSPLRGVIVGSGHHTLSVAVDVTPVS
ncbi:MAG TPA: transglutaminase [Verrucomicrobiales bacterium]|nr:transglutaminase [Verrucomicrobiales bacterium]